MGNQGGSLNRLKIILILALVSAGFFCGEKARAAAVGHIVISEIQVAGKTADDEFIELYNPTEMNKDIGSWSIQYKSAVGSAFYRKNFPNGAIIPAHGFYLIAHKDFQGLIIPDMIHSTFSLSGKFGSGGNIFLVSDQKNLDSTITSTIIDKVGYGVADGSESVPAFLPAALSSIERKPGGTQGNGQDTDNNSLDFIIQSAPNPQNSLSPLNPPLSEETDNPLNPPLPGGQEEAATSTEEIISPNSLYQGGMEENKFGDIVINEFVSDPADNEVEWVELYNKSGHEVDLAGWRLEDGSKSKTVLSGSLAAIGSGRFKVVEKPAGNLNNTGDLIVLYDNAGKIIDQVAYGNWDDGDILNNGPAAADPGSTARKSDGYNTYNNANDFALTIKSTKGISNIIETETENEVSSAAKAAFDFFSDIYLTEILPNPAGDDTKLEFIEIFNAGQRDANLAGWSLSNEDGKKFYLENIAASSLIKAGEYLAVYRPKSKIILHNDKGEVKLFQPLAEKSFRTAAYEKVKEGWSYNLTPLAPLLKGGSDGYWQWSETPTPGKANIIKSVNRAPEVDFSLPAEVLTGQPVIFDGSDTADADGDKLSFVWDFGDGLKNNLVSPQHTYLKAGIFTVSLTVGDGQATSTAEKSIMVGGANMKTENPLTPLYKGGNIIINELFPDAEGADSGQEWLELKNTGAEKINLKSWLIENANGKFKFKNDLWLEAGGYYVLKDKESKLALKNSADTVSLYDQSGNMVDRADYVEVFTDEAYARGVNGKWFWTDRPTPGKENIISVAESGTVLGIKATTASGGYLEVPLEEAKNLAAGSLVKTRGIVAVEPGILGAQIFYLANASGTPAAGLQIYNYKKDFPALKIGDQAEITGELAQTQGEARLKTKEKADIKITGHGNELLITGLSCEAISEDLIGQLISISGEITDKNASTLYLDDGTDETLVYFKKTAAIETKNLTPGRIATITGILSKTASGLRLLPRGQADVTLASAAGLEPKVLGEVAAADEWQLAERDKKLELFKYLLIIAAGVLIILMSLYVKIKKKSG